MRRYLVVPATAPPEALLAARDDAWAHVPALIFGPAPWTTRVRLTGGRDALWLRFDVADERPWHTMTRRDDRLWEEEVVEVFLDPDGGGHHDAELEISPANIVCDLVVVRPWPDLLSDPAWHVQGLQTRVVPFRDVAAGPDGWTATAAIPWAALRSLPCAAALPPRPGDEWRFNVYRIKRPHGPARPDHEVVYAAWSPTGGPSFHVPEAFGVLAFESFESGSG